METALGEGGNRKVPLPLFLCIVLVLAAVVALWRLPLHQDETPRMDHAMFTQWVQGVVESPSLLPQRRDGQSWAEALAADHGSLAGTVLRIVAPSQSMVFTLTTLGVFSGLAHLTGADFQGQVTISILSASLALVLLSLLPPAACGPRDRNRAMALGLGAALAAALSATLATFAALGPHNFGIAALLGGLAALQLHLTSKEDAAGRTFVLMLVVHGLAFYAHYTVTLLLPSITLAALALTPGRAPRRRLRAMAAYCAFGAVLAAPPLLLTLALRLTGRGNTQDLAGLAAWAAANGRGVGWVDFFQNALSPPGLWLGLAGLLLLGLRRGWWLPALTAAVHFAWGMLLPGFAQFDRTGMYLLPLLCLGLAACAVEAITAFRAGGMGRLALPVVAAALGWHLWLQVPALRDPSLTYFWGSRLSGDRPALIRETQALIPDGAVVLPADYSLSHFYRALAYPRSFRDVTMAPPLVMLTGALAAGRLDDYLGRHLPESRPDGPVFVLGYESTALDEAARVFAAAPCGRLGRCGSVTFTPVLRGTGDTPRQDGVIVLYRVDSRVR